MYLVQSLRSVRTVMKLRPLGFALLLHCGSASGALNPPPGSDAVASVEVAPDSLRLELGDVGQGTCTPRTEDGDPTGNPCQWVSGDLGIVRPSSGTQAATFTTVASGDAWIIASVGELSDSTRVTVVDTTREPPPPPPTSAACPAAEFDRFVQVSSGTQLMAALAAARPGDLILLAPGVYQGRFTLSAAGTAEQPICLDGLGQAALTAGTLGGGTYVLYLARARYWRVAGLEVHTGEKGIMVDYSDFNLFDQVHIHDIGNEGLHFRRHSSDNVFQRGRIERTGLRGDPHSGEGAYVGSAQGNWGRYTDGQPDRADRNQISSTVIRDATAECLEVKEGTRGTVIRLNTLGECGDKPSNSPAVLGTRGGSGRFECNTITARDAVDAMAVYSGGPVPGDGDDNLFRWNRVDLEGGGEFFAVGSGQSGNVQVENTTAAHAANCPAESETATQRSPRQ